MREAQKSAKQTDQQTDPSSIPGNNSLFWGFVFLFVQTTLCYIARPCMHSLITVDLCLWQHFGFPVSGKQEIRKGDGWMQQRHADTAVKVQSLLTDTDSTFFFSPKLYLSVLQ